jgi:hypothetical protein
MREDYSYRNATMGSTRMEGTEKIAIDPDGVGVTNFAAGGQIQPGRAPNRNGGKRLLSRANLLPKRKSEIGIRTVEIATAPMVRVQVDDRESIGL